MGSSKRQSWPHVDAMSPPAEPGHFTDRDEGYFTELNSGQCFKKFKSLLPVMQLAETPKPS